MPATVPSVFTPFQTLVGGGLLHSATSTLLSDTGRVFGISGIFDGAIWGQRESWRWAIILGMLCGPVLGWAIGLSDDYAGDAIRSWGGIGLARGVIAGLLVGFGSRLGSGCTSGHFLCGVSRGSPRSLVATGTFFLTALLAANIFPTSNITPRTPLFTSSHTPSYKLIFVTLLGLNASQYVLRRILLSLNTTSPILRLTPYLLSGVTFSIGLLISGMADPSKVCAFLRPFPPWTNFDPSLAMIVISGVIPNAIHWMAIDEGKTKYPWENWTVPTRMDIDTRLICGSAIFGVGWGLVGVCPGPVITGVGRVVWGCVLDERGSNVALKSIGSYFVTMIVGMRLARAV